MEHFHTNRADAQQPDPFRTWEFLNATRDPRAHLSVRRAPANFDLNDVADVPTMALLVFNARCQIENQEFADAATFEKLTADLLRAIADIADTDDVAADALTWLTDPKAPRLDARSSTQIANEIVAAWKTNAPAWAEAWGVPLPLANSLLPVPAMPDELLPESLRPWILDCAERAGAPAEYVAVGAMVALASIVGNTVSILPKRCDDWRVVPNLWGGGVGDPSAKKSPAMDEALKPLARLKAVAIDAHKAAMKEFKIDFLMQEAGADNIKAKVKTMLKDETNDPQTVRAYIERMQESESAAPTLKTYSVQDATIEALSNILERTPRGFLINRDELAGWLRAMDKQGHEQDRAFFLEAFSGTGTNIQIERVGRGTIIVPHCTLSILGTIQPRPFAQLIRAASANGDADGFVARFQMLVYPDRSTEYKHVDRWPDKEAKNRAFKIFETLDNLTPESVGAQLDGDHAFVRFNAEAQRIFDDWITHLETRLCNWQGSELMNQHLGKYRSLMPSLALLLHLVAVADGSAHVGNVSAEAAMMASEWCDFLEAHARRIYAMATDGATDGAQLVAARLGQLPDPFTARDVYRKQWSGLSSPADAEAALARLEERNWIRAEDEPANEKGGRPMTSYWKHPAKAGEK